MPRGVQICNLDSNHTEAVQLLRDNGASVVSLAALGRDCPDLLVGWRGHNVLIEMKDGQKPPSARALSPGQAKFHAEWGGQVATAYSAEEALRIACALLRHWGAMAQTEGLMDAPPPDTGPTLFEMEAKGDDADAF